MSEPGAELRRSMSEGPVVAPGAYDPMTARLVEQAGFPAVYVTGGGVTNAVYGQPDVGIVSYSEMLDAYRRIIDMVTVPVVVDGDTGYGGPANIRRAVRDLEAAGAAGVHFEDQVFPKRCAYLDGVSSVSVDEMRARLSVALDSRRGDDLLIIGRTEARTAVDLEEILGRATAYQEVGADMIFVNGLSTMEEVRHVGSVAEGPLLYNNAGNPASPHLTPSDARELGFDLLIFPSQTLRGAIVAVRRLLEGLAAEGDIVDPAGERVLPFSEWVKLTGVEEIYELEAVYAPQPPTS